MYYQFTDNLFSGALNRTVDKLLKFDNKDESSFPTDSISDQSYQEPKKCRKYATRILKITAETLCSRFGVPISSIQNCTDRNTKLYSTFCQQLVTDGEILWRQHNDNQDTVIMSDYPATGNLSALSYSLCDFYCKPK